MKLAVRQNLKHIVIVILTVALFFTSPIIQQKLTLRASALEVVAVPLPALTKDARMYVDRIMLLSARDEVYQIDGWGFLILDSKMAPTDYERTLLLISDKNTFAVSTSNVPRKDVQTAYINLDLALEESGFAATIPIIALPKGDYVISLLFTLPDGTQTRYDSKFELSRTFNSIQLVQQDDKR